jgi:hypothetical protein
VLVESLAEIVAMPYVKSGRGDALENVDVIHDALAGRNIGRGAGIRTPDLYVPNVARYQAALHPDNYEDGTIP